MWRYGRILEPLELEFADWEGAQPSLATHFHAETQLTVVIEGERRFLIEGKILSAVQGDLLVIPAFVPHRPLEVEDRRALSRNFYVNAPLVELAHLSFPFKTSIARRFVDLDNLSAEGVAGLARGLRVIGETHGRGRRDHRFVQSLMAKNGSVPLAGCAHGLSREAFSRRFHREIGMPPHAYFRARRMIEARHLLKAGLRPAEAAAETGFSDQSHLTRAFKVLYGISPGRYRTALAQQ
jgi:AraC-like DNA-binding protein